MRDNWNNTQPRRRLGAWIGKCEFYEKWSGTTEIGEVAIDKKKEFPRDPVCHDLAERNVQDDLSGDALSPELVTKAKRE